MLKKTMPIAINTVGIIIVAIRYRWSGLLLVRIYQDIRG